MLQPKSIQRCQRKAQAQGSPAQGVKQWELAGDLAAECSRQLRAPACGFCSIHSGSAVGRGARSSVGDGMPAAGSLSVLFGSQFAPAVFPQCSQGWLSCKMVVKLPRSCSFHIISTCSTSPKCPGIPDLQQNGADIPSESKMRIF